MENEVQAAEALELATALLENSDSLLDDAELLWSAGRAARAVALSLVAYEEVGKIYLCLGGITGEGELPSSKSREWTNHRDKLETARALELAFVDQEPDFDMAKVKAEIEWQLQTKMSALYVDHDAGRTRLPASIDADPRVLIDRGRAKSAVLHAILDRVTPEVLEAMKEHGAWMSRIAETLIDEDDPAGTVGRIRAVTAAAALDDDEALRLALQTALTPTPQPRTPA